MAVSMQLRRDGHAAPRVSATFVLAGTPDPDERLGPMIEHATLALDLTVTDPGAAIVDSVDVRLVDGSLGSAAPAIVHGHSTDPFGHVALAGAVRSEASMLLEALVGGEQSLVIAATVTTTTRCPHAAGEVSVDLLDLWTALDAAVDAGRSLPRWKLEEIVAGLALTGVVTLRPGVGCASGWSSVAATALVGAARWVVRPVPDAADAFRVAEVAPPSMTVSAAIHDDASGVASLTATAPLSELVWPAIRHDPSAFVHLVDGTSGRLDGVLPVRTRGRARRRGDDVVGAWPSSGVAERLDAQSPWRPGGAAWGGAGRPANPADGLVLAPGAFASHLLPFQYVAGSPTLIAAPESEVRRPGPVIGDTTAGWWPDRWDGQVAWAAPALTVVSPDPVSPVDDSTFRFEIEPEAGHTQDGRPAISATVTVTVETGPRSDVASISGRPDVRRIEPVDVEYRLAIPFRDEAGADQAEFVPPDAVSDVGSGRTEVVFRLSNDWARLAYGALSTPGFQRTPARLTATWSVDAWDGGADTTREPLRARLAERDTGVPNTGEGGTAQPADVAVALSAPIVPAWHIGLFGAATLAAADPTWSRLTLTDTCDLVVPCSEFGELYRERVDGGWRAIGCRPAFQLGEIEYRTYEAIDVAAAVGWGTVLRSLRSPGRFLLMPDRYAVGRHAAGSPQAYAPTLVLHSTIDIDDPTGLRCVLAAALEADVPPARRAAIVAELRATVHPSPILEYLPETGVEPEVAIAAPGDTEVTWVATRTGFDVVCTTDVAGFLGVRTLIERAGVRGSVVARMPGGVVARSQLIVSAASICGPFETGTIAIERRPDAVVLHNPTKQRVAVRSLTADGVPVAQVDRVLEPAGTERIATGAAGVVEVDYVVEGGNEPIEEIRAYIEDLQMVVVFVAASDPADRGAVAYEVHASLLGQLAPTVVLDAFVRQAERVFLLPLTTYAADPMVEYVVHAVLPDGSRRTGPTSTWPVRSRGPLILVDAPAPTT